MFSISSFFASPSSYFAASTIYLLVPKLFCDTVCNQPLRRRTFRKDEWQAPMNSRIWDCRFRCASSGGIRSRLRKSSVTTHRGDLQMGMASKTALATFLIDLNLVLNQDMQHGVKLPSYHVTKLTSTSRSKSYDMTGIGNVICLQMRMASTPSLTTF